MAEGRDHTPTNLRCRTSLFLLEFSFPPSPRLFHARNTIARMRGEKPFPLSLTRRVCVHRYGFPCGVSVRAVGCSATTPGKNNTRRISYPSTIRLLPPPGFSLDSSQWRGARFHGHWVLGIARGRNACQHRLARYFLWNGHRPLMSHPVLSYSLFFSPPPVQAYYH